MTKDLNFDKICRACCLEGNMMSLFKVHISKKMMACCGIQVWPNDGLPAQICRKCAAKLHIAFQFRKLCEKSDGRLRSYANSKDDEEVEITDEITTNENVDQTTPEIQPSIENRNNFVYVECAAAPSNTLHSENENVQSGITYTPPVMTISQIEGTFSSLPHIQMQPPPSLHYQTYNFPVHVSNTSQILTLAPVGQTTSEANLQGQSSLIEQQIPTTGQQLLEANCKIDNVSSNAISFIQGPLKTDHEADVSATNTSHESHACQICSKEFTTAAKLSRHMKIHSGHVSYQCNVCHKGFLHSGNFKVHLRSHTDERPYKCSMCEKACRQAQDLEKHMRTHTGERPHACNMCEKAFSTSSNLIAHMRIHSGERPYVCSVCQKAFCQSNELTKHARTHTGEKSHTCPICNKGFNGSSTLIVHMRSHTGERPYQCHVCKKTFTQSSCLHIHMKRHKEDLKYQCKFCVRGFVLKSELKLHLTSHKPDNKFGCNMCGKHFCRQHVLIRHMAQKHGVILQD